MAEKPQVTIYTDGACRGNPGHGGWGAIIIFVDSSNTEFKREISAGYELTTNNRMEVLAAIAALESLKVPCNVTLFSDSKYLVSAHREHWIENWKLNGWMTKNKKSVKNYDLWEKLDALEQIHDVKYEWVKGHDKIRYNERCDKLATEAADEKHLKRDVKFEEDETCLESTQENS